ncbi:MAG: molybdopterin-dependent oxidoreductase [Candidatus Bathyarchaeota archaeon]|nr:MAG: molybdopterin-dependent oxidoreductase [Candidatus Bathyarchaeota archaeon]
MLKVYGKVENPFSLTYEEVLALPSIMNTSDFHCVEGWSILDNKWEGVSMKTIVERAKPKEGAKYAIFSCFDGYSTSLLISDLLGKSVLLAYKLGGKMLEPQRGGPLRLIVPQKYAYKSAMWVQGIKFSDENELGYWEKRGYSDTADPWKEERYVE